MSSVNHPRLLSFVADLQIIDTLRKVCAEVATPVTHVTDRSAVPLTLPSKLESLFFDQTPTQVWYYLEVAYALLMPAHTSMSEEVFDFQVGIKFLAITSSLCKLTMCLSSVFFTA